MVRLTWVVWDINPHIKKRGNILIKNPVSEKRRDFYFRLKKLRLAIYKICLLLTAFKPAFGDTSFRISVSIDRHRFVLIFSVRFFYL
jgi:uncharacterized membrane protein (DUF485 family)